MSFQNQRFPKPVMKRYATFLIKSGLILLIFSLLFYRSCRNGTLEAFLDQEKDWRFILLGFLASFVAVIITFIRWSWLNQALGIRLSMRETFRLSFIGYLFNFLPMGIVGGDLVKGVLLAKKNPDLKPACAVSVIMDRVIGLYIMFLIGIVAVYLSGFYRNDQKEAVFATGAILWLTILFTAGLIFLLIPDSGKNRRGRFFQKIPVAGKLLGQLYAATSLYQNKKGVILVSSLATVLVHFLFAVSIWLTALGLWGIAPSLGDHLVIYPIANTGSIIPLSAGPLEIFLDALYPLFTIPGAEPLLHGYGMMVGVAYRMMTILIAAIGGIYYLAGRGEITKAINEIKEEKGA